MTLKRAELFRYLKRGERLMLNEVDGRLWWTDSYLAVPAPAALIDLLDDYNLKAQPMVALVAATIKLRTNVDPPEIATVVDNAAAQCWPAERWTLGEAPAVVESPSLSGLCDVWRRSDVPRGTEPVMVAVDRERFAMAYACAVEAAGSSGSVRWHVGPDGLKPMVAMNDEAKPVGVLMPWRMP